MNEDERFRTVLKIIGLESIQTFCRDLTAEENERLNKYRSEFASPTMMEQNK